MLPLENSAILSSFIKQSLVIKIFVLSFFEWLLKTGFTVSHRSAAKAQANLSVHSANFLIGHLTFLR